MDPQRDIVRPSLRRIFSTLRTRSSQPKRWADPQSLSPLWQRRSEAAAALLPPGSSVIDLGAGEMHLKGFLDNAARYQPADIVSRCEGCLVLDLNRGEVPEGRYDVVSMLGVMEYIHEPAALLQRLHEVAPIFVFSYCVAKPLVWPYRLSLGWVSHLRRGQLETMLSACGWAIESNQVLCSKLQHDERLYLLRDAT